MSSSQMCISCLEYDINTLVDKIDDINIPNNQRKFLMTYNKHSKFWKDKHDFCCKEKCFFIKNITLNLTDDLEIIDDKANQSFGNSTFLTEIVDNLNVDLSTYFPLKPKISIFDQKKSF